jgi:hypothetical protein
MSEMLRRSCVYLSRKYRVSDVKKHTSVGPPINALVQIPFV